MILRGGNTGKMAKKQKKEGGELKYVLFPGADDKK
jgi:hypothetical protein